MTKFEYIKKLNEFLKQNENNPKQISININNQYPKKQK